jgi:hypothetical protein
LFAPAGRINRDVDPRPVRVLFEHASTFVSAGFRRIYIGKNLRDRFADNSSGFFSISGFHP